MQKMIIYQLFPRTFTNYNETRKPNGSIDENGCGKFKDINTKALNAIKKLGATHIWYTGVMEHATQTDYSAYGIAKDTPSIVKGKAGSPYAIKDYYDVDPDLAVNVQKRMEEFEALVARTHKAGLKVVLDFVANHVARQYHSDRLPEGVEDLGATDNPEWAFSPLNNFYYMPGQLFQPQFPINDYHEYPAKATGNDLFSPSPSKDDWYETVKLNYGVYYTGGGEKQFDPVPDTWFKMLHILLFWCGKGADAFRCDMAELVPVEFWGWVIPQVKEVYPDVQFIGEVYNPEWYRAYVFGGKFDYLYDKVGMYDYLRGVMTRDYTAEGITGKWQSTEDILSHMLYFFENHDEQRVASGFFCGSGRAAIPAMIVLATLEKNPLLIYAGQELGEKGMDLEGFSGIDGRSSIFDYWGVKSLQAWANHGKFDGAGLSDKQKQLRLFYQRLLNLCQTEEAIKEGRMFDLEYVQQDNFNRHKQYAFLRSTGKETLLVVVNFDAHEAMVDVRIPRAAFTYLEVEEKLFCSMQELLTGEMLDPQHFSPDQAIRLHLDPWQGMIIRIN